ncbi:MAG TPA: MerR family transcriptional regulator [Firmicutes bacterium]|nr:MerR family transcriptional regulator [Bacillota bacterium]
MREQGLYTVRAAALALGWPPARVRYYEARFRDELRCPREANGDPLFGDRHLRVLKSVDEWLQVNGAEETVIRERLAALSSWMKGELPIVEDFFPSAELALPELAPADGDAGTAGPTPAPAARTATERTGEAAAAAGEVTAGALERIEHAVKDLADRMQGLEETLSALLAYLQEQSERQKQDEPALFHVIKRDDPLAQTTIPWERMDPGASVPSPGSSPSNLLGPSPAPLAGPSRSPVWVSPD